MGDQGNTFTDLRSANTARQKEWDRDNRITLAYRGNELAGEVGEACNLIKKIERERIGLPGSRATREQLAEELADVVICADLIAMDEGIDLLNEAVPSKFNATSQKVGLATRLSVGGSPCAPSSSGLTRGSGHAAPAATPVDQPSEANAKVKTESNSIAALLAAATGLPPASLAALTAMASERRRQIEVEGWTPEHDDEHRRGELAGAAAAYAISTPPGYLTLGFLTDAVGRLWPFEGKWFKPFGSKKNTLEKAAALLLAEWERLDRIETSDVCQCPRP